MDYTEVCSKIFNVNKDIRFVGVVDKSGKLVAGGMRDGLESLDDEIHLKRWLNQISIRREMYEMFDKLYGKTRFAYVEREKLKQLTFYLPVSTVLVTLQPTVSGNSAVDFAQSISQILKSGDMQ
ncbi:MAG: hypothetical protein ACE5J2_03160 [Nitrososphaerales archaeon]